MNRRHFIYTSSLGLTSALSQTSSAIEPLIRQGSAKLRTSLAAYSFRDTFQKEPGKFDMFKFIDYCADQGLEGAEVTSYYFPKEADDEYFKRLKAHAEAKKIALSGTAVGNSFTLPAGPELEKEKAYTKQWIDRAALMSVPHIRVFAGSPKGIDNEGAFKSCVSAMEEVGAYAASKKVLLGIENHGGIVAEPEGLLKLVKAVQSPAIGINLDTGNFHTADPYASLEQCLPYAVNVQVKVEMKPKGAKEPIPVDLARIGKMLKDHRYQGFVALEYEAKPDPWTAVPEWLRQLKAMCQR